jgi:hypothetical protein
MYPAEPDGTLCSADARGGVVRIAAGCSQRIITQNRSQHFQKASTPDGVILHITVKIGNSSLELDDVAAHARGSGG